MAECLNHDDSLNKLGLPPKTGIIFGNLYLMETPGPPVMCERQSAVVSQLLCPCDKTPRQSAHKEERLTLTPQFQWCEPMASCFHCL